MTNKQCTCFQVADEIIVCPVCKAASPAPLPDSVKLIAPVVDYRRDYNSGELDLIIQGKHGEAKKAWTERHFNRYRK